MKKAKTTSQKAQKRRLKKKPWEKEGLPSRAKRRAAEQKTGSKKTSSKPIKKDEEKKITRGSRGVVTTVEPLELGSSGVSCIVKEQRYAITAGVPGDRVRVLLPRRDEIPPSIRNSDEPALAKRLEIVEASSKRKVPPCSLLLSCGACSLQEQLYHDQIADKEAALKRVIHPLNCTNVEFRGIEKPFGYRTKLSMAAGGKPGQLVFGFYPRGSFGDPIHAEGCPVQHPLTLSTLAMVKQALNQANIPPTNAKNSRIGWLHGVIIRVDPLRVRAEVTLLAKNDRIRDDLKAQLSALPGVDSVHLSVNPKRSSYALGDVFKHLGGSPSMSFSLKNQSFLLSPGSFFQTNYLGADVLADAVLELMPTRFKALADLYGGVGVFSRLSAGRWEKAVVAEYNPSAVDDLRRSLDREHLPIRVVPGRLENTIKRVLDAQADVVLMDPPRKGCHPNVINALKENPPQSLIYIACGIEALLKDSKRLLKAGFKLERVIGVDMFPHTPHIETVALFSVKE